MDKTPLPLVRLTQVCHCDVILHMLRALMLSTLASSLMACNMCIGYSPGWSEASRGRYAEEERAFQDCCRESWSTLPPLCENQLLDSLAMEVSGRGYVYIALRSVIAE